jgi:hypothetical protein
VERICSNVYIRVEWLISFAAVFRPWGVGTESLESDSERCAGRWLFALQMGVDALQRRGWHCCAGACLDYFLRGGLGGAGE